ncbi:MAG: cytochrome c maturation protein CcmE [Pseudomonadota bacterium]
MRARSRRLWTVSIAAALLLAAVALVFVAARDNANLFYTPSRIADDGGPDVGERAKVGGFVELGSLEYGADAMIGFRVIDESEHSIRVTYRGVAPDLFREGSGVVATGAFNADGAFVATQLLAKHDENYVPRELKDVGQPAS